MQSALDERGWGVERGSSSRKWSEDRPRRRRRPQCWHGWPAAGLSSRCAQLPRSDSRISWATYEESRVRTAAAPSSPDAADDDAAAPVITTAALEAAASDPASDPALSVRLEGYILTWADPSGITPSFLATKWLRSLRRDIRRDLPAWLGTTGAVPEARPPAPKARGAWADDADRTPQPSARKPGGKPELMGPDQLLSCLTRLADYGKLGEPSAPLRVAIERAFKERATTSPSPLTCTLTLTL